MERLLNCDLLCDAIALDGGPENSVALRVEIVHQTETDSAWQADDTPTRAMAGCPDRAHAGAPYTALDCVATWVATMLGPNREAAWVLRSAQTVYHNPAPAGEPLTLIGWIKEQGGRWDPLIVGAEARRADGALCLTGEFKVVPLTAARRTETAEPAPLPENWQARLAGAPAAAQRARRAQARNWTVLA